MTSLAPAVSPPVPGSVGREVEPRPPAPFSGIAAAIPTWAGPAWLNDVRKAALARFETGGLPTPRLESWRTTPLPDLGSRPFEPGFASTANRARALVEPFADGDAILLVFVDGLHSVTLSSSEASWPEGVGLAPISRLLAVKPDELRPWFSADEDPRGSLHDLNTAAFRDGARIVVEKGAAIRREIRIVLVSTTPDPPVARHLRSLIHLSEGSSLRLTVATVGTPDARGFSNHHVTASLAGGARLDLVRLHESPPGLPHFDALAATLGAEATLRDTLLQTGASWTRSELDIVLDGERARADLGGLFLARGRQISDVHTVVSHRAPGAVSRQEYRGLAADEGRGVFHGQIEVQAEARGTDATQHNRNMLLSRKANVHSTPALEILTDDVKCKHGSATGRIDPGQLFYLRSRGLGLEDAVRILTDAFVAEIVSRVGEGSARRLVESQIRPSLSDLGTAGAAA